MRILWESSANPPRILRTTTLLSRETSTCPAHAKCMFCYVCIILCISLALSQRDLVYICLCSDSEVTLTCEGGHHSLAKAVTLRVELQSTEPLWELHAHIYIHIYIYTYIYIPTRERTCSFLMLLTFTRECPEGPLAECAWITGQGMLRHAKTSHGMPSQTPMAAVNIYYFMG